MFYFSGSNATAGEPIGTSVLPSRIQANLNSIEEAGVGPMAPLVEDALCASFRTMSVPLAQGCANTIVISSF